VAVTPYDAKGSLPRANTLAHHAQAAATFFNSTLSGPLSIYTSGGSKPALIPYLKARIELRSKWEQPREKREPYTHLMFQVFSQQVEAAERADPLAFLDKLSLVFNTQCLGIFTGSRVSEYAQSKGSRATISRVPVQPGQCPSEAKPVAFIAEDFLFLSKEGTIIPHKELFLQPQRAVSLHVTFRHDKSGRNYCVRKYGRGKEWLCPIGAAAKLLYRAHLLKIPRCDPICAFRAKGHASYAFLRDTDVTDTMRTMCIAAYPDPKHFLRLNIKRFASHSNRVTAAVALSQSNMSINDIAHRLRWKPESVEHYLRESARDIGAFTANAIIGAQRDFR
jgi:hypothetical protein